MIRRVREVVSDAGMILALSLLLFLCRLSGVKLDE